MTAQPAASRRRSLLPRLRWASVSLPLPLGLARPLARLAAHLPRIPKASPTARLALGLLSLTISLVLVSDLLLGLFPDWQSALKYRRERSAVALTTQAKIQLQSPEGAQLLGQTLEEIVRATPDLLSVGIRRQDGLLVAASAAHAQLWKGLINGRSTLQEIVVPLNSPQGVWGQVEMHYAADDGSLFMGLSKHLLLLLAGLGSTGLLGYYLYLRRSLQHLDPAQAIPERVRTAFNTLSEGLLVLDQDTRILMANDAFLKLVPQSTRLIGRPVHELTWLTQALEGTGDVLPWTQALQQSEPVRGVGVQLALAEEVGRPGEIRHALLNCAALRNAAGQARGCLLTLDDITELDRANARLRHALGELEDTRDAIQRQNIELQQLASFDPLTGCLNRRAFVLRAEQLLAHAQETGEPLACLMADIDKFKSFNDTYGHAVGDQVIQQVARLLRASIRTQDVLARWGGEEFCMLLPGCDLQVAMRIADTIRTCVEVDAGPGVRAVEGLRITASWGVATLVQVGQAGNEAGSLDQLIDLADQGLYAAKQTGRNRVCCVQAGSPLRAEVPTEAQT